MLGFSSKPSSLTPTSASRSFFVSSLYVADSAQWFGCKRLEPGKFADRSLNSDILVPQFWLRNEKVAHELDAVWVLKDLDPNSP